MGETQDLDVTKQAELEDKDKIDPKKAQDALTPDHPRFQEVWKKQQIAELEVGKLQSSFNELASHNQKLEEKLLEQEQKNTSRVTSNEIGELRKAKRQAMEEGDWATVDSVDDKMLMLREEQLVAKLQKNNSPSSVVTTTVDPAKQLFDATVEGFISATPWYKKGSTDYDSYMAGAAERLDTELAQSMPDVATRLKEVKKRVEEKFNWKGAGTGIPGVETHGKPGSTSGGDKIELNTAQKEIIARLYKNDPDGEKRYIKTLQIMKERE